VFTAVGTLAVRIKNSAGQCHKSTGRHHVRCNR
jgi:hypothetical protein